MIQSKQALIAFFAAILGAFARPDQSFAEWRSGGRSSGAVFRSSTESQSEHDFSNSSSSLPTQGLTIGDDALSSTQASSLHDLDSLPPIPLVLFRAYNFHRFTGPLGLVRLKFYSNRHPFWPLGRILIHKHFGHCPHLPEPSSLVLAGVGGTCVAIAAFRRRIRSKQRSSK